MSSICSTNGSICDTPCMEGAKKVLGCAVFALGVVVVGAVAIAVAPLVAVVALAIFAIKALINWNRHSTLYNQTLDANGHREQFGRVAGQDYTQWNGQARVGYVPTEQDRRHAEEDSYLHGGASGFSNRGVQRVTTFIANEDQAWLRLEEQRIKGEQDLNQDLKMMRAAAKALIPVIGVIWLGLTELGRGGASEIPVCRVCVNGGEDLEQTHWSLSEALSHHIYR